MARSGKTETDKVVIQKYANRRLYNKATSAYITLDDLSKMVREGVDFVVYDAKTNEDITHKVLTQIIFEEENSGNGQNLLPIQFLRQLISFYGDSMQAFLPSYLEMSLDSFAKQQEDFRKNFAAGGLPSLQPEFVKEQARQNMKMFEQAMKMFAPFNYAQPANTSASSEPKPEPKAATGGESEIDTLKAQLSAMQDQLNKLSTKDE